MTSKLLFQDPSGFVTPLLVVFAVDIATGKDDPASPVLLTTSDALSAATAPWLATDEFKAAVAECLLLRRPDGLKAQRLLVIGLGKAKSLTANEVRKAAGTAIRVARPRGIRDIAIAFPEDRALSDEHLDTLPCYLAARAIAEGVLLADFDIDFYRSDRKDLTTQSVTVLFPDADEETRNDCQRGWAEGTILGESQNFTRTLVNEPGNILTPTELGRRATAMANEHGLTCEVHSTDRMKELRMGAFLAVAQGSAQPPALIVLRYDPPTAPAADAPVLGLVGKGITFDTGGISIKPADNMEKMKYDMAGAGAMLGAMRAIALLKPAVRVLCVICSCENMPSGRAYKPGDVLTAMSGKTIEVLNTDAEGRLVLADGLHYAQTLGATRLINAATLTGAISIALGQLNAGLFSNNDQAARRFLDLYPVAGEKFWQMPCTDDYREQIKSSIADIMNTGGSRYGGAIAGAMFLKEFVGDTPWIHLDIAGTAWIDDQKPWQSKGPSGIGVRSITEWVRSHAE
jgi:leucyl aminopeptidase